MTLQNHLFTNTIPLPTHHPILFLNSPKKSVAKSDTFSSKSIAFCNLFPPHNVKKMYEVWGIIAVFKLLQR